MVPCPANLTIGSPAIVAAGMLINLPPSGILVSHLAARSHGMTTTPTDEEIALLARQAGLDLPPEYLQELVDAYGHVRRTMEHIPAVRPRGDEPAHVFVPTKFLPKGE